MGGRVAEELIYGPDNISCGAVSDIEKSSRLARNMVAVYGFSDEIGFMAVGEYKGKYLGTEFCYMVGDKLRDCAEEEQNKILKSCMEKTRKILKENKELLLQIARELFDKKEITGEEMEKIYADATGKRQIN